MVNLENMSEGERREYEKGYGEGVKETREAGLLDNLFWGPARGFMPPLDERSVRQEGYEQGRKDYFAGKTE